MKKLKVRSMKSHPPNPPLRGFLRVVLPVPNHRMANGRKLHPDLVLQPGGKRNPQQGRTP